MAEGIGVNLFSLIIISDIPQLHIIENRYRIERQILLGRQAIRRAMRSRAQERAEAEPQGRLPPPITGTKLSAPMMGPSHSTDSPLPMDSDAEAAYANGSTRPRLRRNHSRRSTTQISLNSPNASAQDLKRAFAARRRWPTNRSPDGDSGDDIPQIDYGRATPDPPPEPDSDPEAEEQELPAATTASTAQSSSIPASPSLLFKRLRNASFSPFATMRRRNSRLFGSGFAQDAQQPSGSSESSSEDDDISVLSRRVWNASNASISDEDDADIDVDVHGDGN